MNSRCLTQTVFKWVKNEEIYPHLALLGCKCSGKCEQTLSFAKNVLSYKPSAVPYFLESLGGGREIKI